MGDDRRILLVDDEPTILFGMSDYLSRLGYVVDSAGSEKEARAYASATRYALVIVDLRVGRVLEGLSFVDFLRAHSPATRILMLTAYGSPEVESEARSRGVDAFLHKPQPMCAVAKLISDLLEHKR